jgi:hypothetical protein
LYSFYEKILFYIGTEKWPIDLEELKKSKITKKKHQFGLKAWKKLEICRRY